MQLYKLSEEYNTLKSILEDEGATPEAVQAGLEQTQADFNDKAESIGKLYLSLMGEASAISAEVERLNARKQTAERKAEWLKTYLLNEMLATKTDKIKGDLVTLSVRTNPASVSVIELNALPENFRRIIPETWQPDKKMILDHVKSTGEIPNGCEIVTDKKSLVIK